MSHFYASIQGNRGEATRQGGKHINGHIRGWECGVRVLGFIDPDTKEDTFHVYLTGGSGGCSRDHLIGTFTKKDL